MLGKIQSIFSKRQRLRHDIRKRENQLYFQEIKKRIQQQQQEKEKQVALFREENQKYFLEEIVQFDKNNEKGTINFNKIRSYVAGFSGTFSFEFVHQLTRIILNHFKQDKTALSTLQHLSQRTELIKQLTDLDLKSHLIELIEYNIDKEKDSQIEWLVCLIIYRLFQKFSNKLVFDFLPDYYEIMMQQLGFSPQAFILRLIVSASNYETLLPKTRTIRAIIKKSITQSQKMSQTSLYLVCQIFRKFLIKQKSLQLQFYNQFVDWILVHIEFHHYQHNLTRKIFSLLEIIIRNEILCEEQIQALWQNKKFIVSICNIVLSEMVRPKGQTFYLLFLLMCRIPFSSLHQIMQLYSLMAVVQHYLSRLLQKDAFKMLCLLEKIIESNPQYIVQFELKSERRLIQNYIDSSQVEIQKIAIKVIALLKDYDIKQKDSLIL